MDDGDSNMKGGEDDMCIICFDPIGAPTDKTRTQKLQQPASPPCTHRYHFPCIRKWSKNKNMCPL